RALERRAGDYVQKPLDLNEIGLKVEHALRSIRHRRELSYYRGRQAAAARIDGESEAVQRLRSLVDRLTRLTGGAGGPPPPVLVPRGTRTGPGHHAPAPPPGGGARGGPLLATSR